MIKIYYHKTIITLIPSIKYIWSKKFNYKSLEISFLFWDININL